MLLVNNYIDIPFPTHHSLHACSTSPHTHVGCMKASSTHAGSNNNNKVWEHPGGEPCCPHLRQRSSFVSKLPNCPTMLLKKRSVPLSKECQERCVRVKNSRRITVSRPVWCMGGRRSHGTSDIEFGLVMHVRLTDQCQSSIYWWLKLKSCDSDCTALCTPLTDQTAFDTYRRPKALRAPASRRHRSTRCSHPTWCNCVE